MERIDTVRKIDYILDNHCKDCQERSSRYIKESSYEVSADKFCRNECSHGLNLKDLGDILILDVKKRRDRR